MPFFENAQGVNIRGGTFNDNHGPQNNHIYSADHNAYYDTGHREDAAPALALKILSARRESNIVQQQAIGGQGYPRITDRQASVFSDSNASETYFSPGPADSRQFSHRLNSSSVTSPQRSYAENTFQHAPHPHTPRYSPSPSTPSPRPASQSPPPCRSNRSCHRSALPLP
ncbi:hypothetical protein NP233_g7478 [Leucocoprinus birnbaumii]|uniref:Uncharacterized protein n=1 Tax=Leucocoprinus birnbaumii TaxID=56174 RepID=A0AAD5VR31_9AGAR|nr:hypothetical protein NP233_g7478 [Leucocoprinus birnbaumii]